MGRILLAFRSFFGILFSGALPDDAIIELGLTKPAPPAPPPAPAADHTDGAVELLAILQRDSRLVDFLMEDISAYEDDQVGAAVRSLHDQCRDSLLRYVRLVPVIDAVEGTQTSVANVPNKASMLKFIGNVPAQPPKSGMLRHKGWRAEKIELPTPKHGEAVVAPAEIEIE
ncbi:MAG: DUF2760 domain-containing protein [Acidobacteriota bacterium]